MKDPCIVFLLLTYVSFSFGQTPTVSPTPSASSENSRTRNFGSSLEKYDKKKPQNSQYKRKSKVPDDDDIIRVETDLVVNDVLVSDQQGNVITGLRKEDFIVLEDGASQTVEMFFRGENATVPRSIVLIIDSHALQAPYFKNSIQSAKLLVEKLNPDDKMAIVAGEVTLWADFTQDKILLKNSLDSLEQKGIKLGRGGLEFHALLAVLNEMFTVEDRRPIIIFQGDGREIIWLKTDKDAPYPVSHSTRMNSGMKYIGETKSIYPFGFSEVKEAIERSGATIYSVIPGIRFFGLPEKERRARAKISFDSVGTALGIKRKNYSPEMIRMYENREEKVGTAGQAAMYRVAELSGGNTAIMEKPEDAERIYSAIFATIESRYVIGYYPTNQKQAGKRRVVKMEIRGHPEYIITGRDAYLVK